MKNGKTYVIMETARTGYAPSQLGSTLTVGELIEELEQYDDDMPIIFSNDNGYTYGEIDLNTVRRYTDYDDEDEEDEEDWCDDEDEED